MIQISFAKSTNVELVEVGLGKVYRGTRYERGGTDELLGIASTYTREDGIRLSFLSPWPSPL